MKGTALVAEAVVKDVMDILHYGRDQSFAKRLWDDAPPHPNLTLTQAD